MTCRTLSYPLSARTIDLANFFMTTRYRYSMSTEYCTEEVRSIQTRIARCSGHLAPVCLMRIKRYTCPYPRLELPGGCEVQCSVVHRNGKIRTVVYIYTCSWLRISLCNRSVDWEVRVWASQSHSPDCSPFFEEFCAHKLQKGRTHRQINV